MVHAAVRIFLQKLGDWRILAERLKKLDLRIGQVDEDNPDPVIRLVDGRRHLSA